MLGELLVNDGPEFCYTIEFWKKDDMAKKSGLKNERC